MRVMNAKSGEVLATCNTLNQAVAIAAKLVKEDPTLVAEVR